VRRAMRFERRSLIVPQTARSMVVRIGYFRLGNTPLRKRVG
jgi:hypothetical protein